MVDSRGKERQAPSTRADDLNKFFVVGGRNITLAGGGGIDRVWTIKIPHQLGHVEQTLNVLRAVKCSSMPSIAANSSILIKFPELHPVFQRKSFTYNRLYQ